MRRTSRSGSFFVCLVFNMLLNLEGLIPAAVLLVLHYVLDWSLWLTFAAVGLWVLYLVAWMAVIGWAGPMCRKKTKIRIQTNIYNRKESMQWDLSKQASVP